MTGHSKPSWRSLQTRFKRLGDRRMPSVVEPRHTLSEEDVWTAEAPARAAEVVWSPIVSLGGGLRVQLRPNSPEWLFPVLNRLKLLLSLKPNWDSYGARAIHPNAVMHA